MKKQIRLHHLVFYPRACCSISMQLSINLYYESFSFIFHKILYLLTFRNMTLENPGLASSMVSAQSYMYYSVSVQLNMFQLCIATIRIGPLFVTAAWLLNSFHSKFIAILILCIQEKAHQNLSNGGDGYKDAQEK